MLVAITDVCPMKIVESMQLPVDGDRAVLPATVGCGYLYDIQL